MTGSPIQRFDPRQFLDLAILLSQSTNEGELRSAVSRAYYAVFLKAREALQSDGTLVLTRTGRDHGLVVRALRSRARSEGNQLDRLRVQRSLADYDLNRPVQRAQVAQLVEIAQSLWTRL
jgi:uncharacterized protein (UPF0332 family)